MADWKDIEQLQQDLKRAQESTTTQKLSERNCIEIILKLKEMNLLDIIHTMDGKEYITPAQLTQDIRDELYMHGGRVSLNDLQSLLNVDYSHIEARANEIVSSSNAIYLVLGQLVDRTYLDHVAEEINDTLQSLGQVRIADLCKTYDLPGKFLIAELVSRLGTIIDGRLDENNKDAIFTEAFITRHKARIRGVLTAVTRPTILQPILGECNMSSKLFYAIVDELITEKRICGEVLGKRSEKSTFLPEMYVRTQNNYIDGFYQQNGYLEYTMLNKFGITDAKSYVKRRFNDALPLSSVAVGSTIVSLVSATVEETQSSGGWVDVQPILPSPFMEEDCRQLLQHAMKDHKSGFVVKSVFACNSFADTCRALFDPLIKEKAEISAKDATVFALTEEEMDLYSTHMSSVKRVTEARDISATKRDTAEGSKKRKGGGSGIGGREVKTRGKDKKRLKKQRELEAAMEEEVSSKQSSTAHESEFMDVEEITNVLSNNIEDCPADILEAIAEQLYNPLNQAYKEQSKSVFQLIISEQNKKSELTTESSDAPVVTSKKKSRKVYEEEINTLWSNIKLFVDAFESFGDETAILLRQHLLQSLCTDLVNILYNMVGAEYLTGIEESSKITSDIRIKILTRLPEEYHRPLKTLHQNLTGKNMDDFVNSLTEACSANVCDVMLKKVDKKRERQVLHGYKMSLIKQLEEEVDPATALHLTAAIIFQNITGKMLHMPGKCVPHVVLYLRNYVAQDVYDKLVSFQTLVIQNLAGEKLDIKSALITELPKLRTLAATTKKKVSGGDA